MDFEETLRTALAERAEDADVAVPVTHRARTAVRRRRTRATVVAAVAAVVVVALAAVVTTRHFDDAAVPTGPVSESPYDVGPAGFRLEVWHDVAVRVPASWGWGSSPNSTTVCATGAIVGPDGHRLQRPDRAMPYVGRPIPTAGRCWRGEPVSPRHVPFVWIGAGWPSGTTDMGGGWVQETRAVAGTSVTVYSDDPALRRAVLSSAHRWTGACAPRLDTPPTASSGPGIGPESMTVCAYAADDTAAGDVRGYDLLAETTAEMGPAKDLVAAVSSAPQMGEYSCYGGQGGEWVLIQVNGAGSTHRDYVVDMQCPSITDPAGVQHQLTYADVAPWAMTGVNAVLHGSPLIRLPVDFFLSPAR